MVIYSGFTHWKWWFSIVMLVYQRVPSNRLRPKARRSLPVAKRELNRGGREGEAEWEANMFQTSKSLWTSQRARWWSINHKIIVVNGLSAPFQTHFERFWEIDARSTTGKHSSLEGYSRNWLRMTQTCSDWQTLYSSLVGMVQLWGPQWLAEFVNILTQNYSQMAVMEDSDKARPGLDIQSYI